MRLHSNRYSGITGIIPTMVVIAAFSIIAALPNPGIGSAASLLPGTPLHASATAGTNTVNLKWTSASSPAKFPVLLYVVTSSPASRGCHVVARRSTVYSCVIGGLQNASRYNFFIKARNIHGFGAVAFVVIQTRGGGTVPVSTITTTVPVSTTTTTAPVPTTTTTTLPAVRSLVLWSSSGSGAMAGPKFTVPAQATSWTENWSYNCSNFGTSGNFITSVTGFGGNRNTSDSGSNQLGSSGSGVNHYYDTGNFNIEVNSECNWTESIVATGPIPSDFTPSPPPSASNGLWSESGQGATSGPQFTVPISASGWSENWSYNCNNFGTSGNFITSVTGYGASQGTSDSGANELGLSGSGTNYYYDIGTFNIQVNTECNWTESVGSF